MVDGRMLDSENVREKKNTKIKDNDYFDEKNNNFEQTRSYNKSLAGSMRSDFLFFFFSIVKFCWSWNCIVPPNEFDSSSSRQQQREQKKRESERERKMQPKTEPS